VTGACVFRYDDTAHEYFLNDARIPSITQLLKRGGLVDCEEFFTEASRERGRLVHTLAMDYDLGVLNPQTVQSTERAALLAYAAAVSALKPTDFDGGPGWECVEIADAHPGLRFGGRLDRVGVIQSRKTIAELKRGAKADYHAIQTALQALLAEHRWKVPAKVWNRLTIYLKSTGRFSVEQHKDARDFDVAFSLIKRFCHVE
jgi:hypothetical protein